MVYVVVKFYSWLKFSFLLFLGIVMHDNEFECVCESVCMLWFSFIHGSNFLFFYF